MYCLNLLNFLLTVQLALQSDFGMVLKFLMSVRMSWRFVLKKEYETLSLSGM